MKKIVCLMICLFAGSVNASVILGPTGVDVSAIDTSIYGSDNTGLINQSGLSSTYVSGVTDFDLFTSTTTAAYDRNLSNYGLGGVAGLGSFYFDLGNLYSVDSIATWGQDCCSATMTNYDLYASDTFGASGSRVLIGSFTGGTTPNAFVHNFDSISAQFFEVDVTANGGYTAATRMNEIVFGGATISVPETSSIAMLLLGLAVLGFSRKKRVS